MRRVTTLLLSGILLLTGYTVFASNDNKIVKLSDNAWITRAGSTNRASANIDEALQNGDCFETLRGNTARISIGGEPENLIHVNENTSLTLAEKDSRTEVDVEKGEVVVSVKQLKPRAVFKVTTPTSVAVVRGTQFEVALVGDVTRIYSFTGTVEVARRNRDGSVSKENILLKPGEKTQIEGFEGPLKAEQMSAGEIYGMEAILREIGALEEEKAQIAEERKEIPAAKKEEKDPLIIDTYVQDDNSS